MKLILEPDQKKRPTSKTIWKLAADFLEPNLVNIYR